MPPRRKDAAWCVIETNAVPPRLWCKHCDTTWPLPLPMRVEAAVVYFKSFTMQHKHCKSQEAHSD